MFGTNITPVNEPWNSHGTLLVVGVDVYFTGDLNDPTSLCGNDPLVMKRFTMQPIGVCPADGLVSYHLVPDDTALPPGS
jgi:hypothetical protein